LDPLAAGRALPRRKLIEAGLAMAAELKMPGGVLHDLALARVLRFRESGIEGLALLRSPTGC
jgi:hypothetical protein